MERREAPAFLARGARLDGRLVRHSVLHPLAFRRGEKKGKTAYPAPQRIRALELVFEREPGKPGTRMLFEI